MTGHPSWVGQVLTLVRAGLMAIRSAGNTKRDSGELIIAALFSGTPEARTRGKMSIFGVPTLDLGLFPLKDD
jgi:hypothetical protein